jgi:glycosyltransferase involved in cell wall biosynthesis
MLLGLKQNPYPYVAKATIYIQPSRYEGKSIAIDEAKILGKPLLVTNYPSAKDQIEHGTNGLLSETNPEALANSIIQLLENEKLREKFILYLKNENLDSTSEILKLYELLDGY